MKSPFKFLDAFTLSDKDAFFGRDQEIHVSYNTVFKTPLLLIYGSSGTGKTSLIQCGLANRFDGPDWYPIFIRRNDNLNDSLASVLQEALGGQAKGDVTADVSLLLRKTLRPVYLLFDQFEELFIRGQEDEQKKFMTSLRALLDAALPCKIVLIMREEFIAQLYSYEELIPELFDHRFRVEVMGPGKVKSVISSSFDRFNIHLAEPKEELLDLMVSNINDPKAGITLPYLQVYLDMLYRDVHKKKFKTEESEGFPHLDITKADIDSLGRIDNVLERFLEDQTKALQTKLEATYGEVNSRFIQSVLNVFVTDEGTKNPITYKMDGENIVLPEEASMFLGNIPPEILTDIILTLQSDRILRKDNKTIELAHDSLALVIHRRKSESDRLLQNMRRRVLNAYEEYKKTGAYLNRKQLSAFDQFRSQIALTPELEKFLDDCESEIVRKENEEQNRLIEENKRDQEKKLARVRMMLFSVIGLLVVGATIAMWRLTEAKNDQLKEENVKLAVEKQISNAKADSIKNIIDLVDQQISKLDSTMSGDLPKFQMPKHLIALKSLVRNKKMTDEEMEANYISVVAMLPMDSQEDEGSDDEVPVLHSKSVFLAMKLRTPRPKEFIQVNWIRGDSNDIINSSFLEVEAQKDSNTLWVGLNNTFKEVGKFTAEVLNSQGVKVGRKKFIIADVPIKEDQVGFTEYSALITSRNRPSLDQPPVMETSFQKGEILWFWLRINSPQKEEITVELQDDNGKVEPKNRKKFTTEINTDKGARIYSSMQLTKAGPHYIRVLNSRGFELEGFVIQVKELTY